MNEAEVLTLAEKCGVIDNFEIGNDTDRQRTLDLECLGAFANACCEYQRESDAKIVRLARAYVDAAASSASWEEIGRITTELRHKL